MLQRLTLAARVTVCKGRVRRDRGPASTLLVANRTSNAQHARPRMLMVRVVSIKVDTISSLMTYRKPLAAQMSSCTKSALSTGLLSHIRDFPGFMARYAKTTMRSWYRSTFEPQAGFCTSSESLLCLLSPGLLKRGRPDHKMCDLTLVRYGGFCNFVILVTS